MKRVDLRDGWTLIDRPPQNMPREQVTLPTSDAEGWMAVAVPGDVNATLVQRGKMPDPRYDTQGRECYWVTAREWWYRLAFDVAKAGDVQATLCLDRVDGPADIWLNDAYVGETRNAFRLFRFEVGGLLKPKGNVLLVRFRSIDELLGGPRLDELAGWKGRRAFLRKPQFCFGWDWALPIPSIGLAGDVWIEIENDCRLTDVAIQTFTSGRVDLQFEVTPAAKARGYEIHLRIAGHGADIERTMSRDRHKSYVSVRIPDPQLWYPNGYGDQPLYDYVVELIVDGEIVDTHSGRLGLRESQIAENPFTAEAGPGFSFGLEINGAPIFCKGANWVPLELWPGTAKPEQYVFYLQKAREANFNMLRIWGGGIYEPELFYELCDELGIMVWQDFMFASTSYPVDVLRDEIIAEAEYQVRRLRNHPSIVIWCGCNEDVYSWSYPDSPTQSLETMTDSGVYSTDSQWEIDRLKADPQIYSMILRGTVSRLGLSVPYVESSPQSRDDYGNMPNSGNCHISCWKYALFDAREHPERFRDHFDQVCSFDSEFCIQGPCSEAAFKRFMAPENLWPPNEAWIYHIQRGHANIPHYEQTLLIAGAILGEIQSLQDYVKHGQATHVEMMRAEFESARRDRPNNGGTMVWMYNDCWPTSNWSIIDYYREPKPAYYAAKRACAPQLPIIMQRAGKVEFFFANDTLEDTEVELSFGQETLQGEPVWSRKRTLIAKANATMKFEAIARSEISIPKGHYLYVDAKTEDGPLPRAIYFPDGWRDIHWPHPEIALELMQQTCVEGKWYSRVAVRTDAFARLCHVFTEQSAFFSDNYFDLSAGGNQEIHILSEQKIEPGSLHVGHWQSTW
jgi:beta-mannosidase